MGKKHRKRPQHHNPPEHHEPPSAHLEGETSMIYTVKIQPHPEEENRYTEERTYRKNQLNAAKHLNLIRAGGAVIAFLAFVALVWYACITHRQLGAMLNSNNLSNLALINAKEQFRISQRPYVWVMPSNTSENTAKQVITYSILPNQPVQVTLWYQNYGQSPAVITDFSADAEIGPNAVHKLHRITWHRNDSVLPPGKADTFSVLSTERVGPDSRSFTIAVGGLATYVRVRYHDLSGHPYESDMCLIHVGGGIPAQFCPYELKLNRMIDCKEERCEE